MAGKVPQMKIAIFGGAFSLESCCYNPRSNTKLLNPYTS